MKIINVDTIDRAYKRISKHVIKTPIITNEEINNSFGAKVYFKLECNQKTGSFKIRGALNKILQLTKYQKKKGIIAFSSGNHGQAVSYAAKLLNINSTVVMPEDAPRIKIDKTKKNGAKIIFYDRYRENREKIAMNIAKKTNQILIKPFDDEDIIIGQGTAGLEITKELTKKNIVPDTYLCCCSGGGLIAGTSTYLKSYFSDLSVYCVEPKNYDDMRISLKKGKLIAINPTNKTLCDALTVNIAGKKTFRINKKLLSGGLSVSDSQVKKAVTFLKNKLDVIAEPSGAAPTAAFLSNAKRYNGKVIVIMISGGNVDKNLFKQIINNE